MTKLSKAAQVERNEAIKRVKAWLRASPKDKHTGKPVVYTSLRRVSRSGMSRVIACYIPAREGGMVDATWSIAKILGERIKRTDCGEGISVGGCGMDMGFHIVYNLGYYLWPKGTPKPHGTRNGEADSAGGYAIKHQWL